MNNLIGGSTADGGDVLQRIENSLYPETAEETPVESSSTEEKPEENVGEVTETDVEEAEETDEVEAADDSEEETEDTDSEGDEEEPQETTDDEEYLELSQVAQVLGLDEGNLTVSEDGDLLFETKVDGETGAVKLQDLLKSYQTDKHVTNKSKAFEEQKKEFEANITAESEQLRSQITEVATVSQILESQLTTEYQSIDWDKLRHENPAEWTAKRQEFQDRVNTINAAKAKAQSIWDEKARKAEEDRQSQYQDYLESEARALSEAIPTWTDPKVAEQELNDLGSFISESYGFDPKDIELVENHRLILMARDAMAYRTGLKKADVIKKKVTKLPKLRKPGAQVRETESQARKKADEKKKYRLRKTGSVKDLASLLEGRV